MGCPSCGAEIPYDQRFAVLTVCEYCNTAVIFDQKAASIAGKMAVLAKSDGPLYLGATGSLKNGLPFRVIGRVRYGYENGFWDEWYLQHEDLSTSWLTEDEKRFMHEQPIKLEVDQGAILALSPGQNIELNDIKFSVREKGTAHCEGGEGQLPFKIISGEQVPFLDLVGALGQTATIEIEPEGDVKFFQGRPLEYSDISVDMENHRPDTMNVEATATAGMRERVTYDASRMKSIQCIHCGGSNDGLDLTADHIKCVHCDMSLEMPAAAFECPGCSCQVQSYTPEAKSVSCQYCGSTVSLGGGEPTLLRKLKKDELERRQRFKLDFPLGSKAVFDNLEFTFVGYLRFKEVDDGIYISNEYLLYNQQWGYRWLVCYEGHYTLQEKLTEIPQIPLDKLNRLYYKQSFTAAGKSWKFYERGSGDIDWVDGELPWIAQKGDSMSYYEAISVPEMLVCEATENEVEWSLYRYLEADELAAAVKRKPKMLRSPRGVGACQPNKKKASYFATAFLALAFSILSFVLFFAALAGGSKVTTLEVSKDQYSEEFLTDPFKLDHDNGIYRADFYSPVSNSWVYLDIALVNEKEQAILDFSAEMSYYSGVDSDGSWSEGSTEDSTYFKANKGTYRFLVLGSAGSGSSPANINHGKTVSINLYQGVQVVYYYIILAIFAGLVFLFHILQPIFFESSRWKHTVSDD